MNKLLHDASVHESASQPPSQFSADKNDFNESLLFESPADKEILPNLDEDEMKN